MRAVVSVGGRVSESGVAGQANIGMRPSQSISAEFRDVAPNVPPRTLFSHERFT